MLLTIFKDAIATRKTNILAEILLATQPSPRTISIIAFALIVDNDEVITTVKFAQQLERSVIIVVFRTFCTEVPKAEKVTKSDT